MKGLNQRLFQNQDVYSGFVELTAYRIGNNNYQPFCLGKAIILRETKGGDG
jgi:hypothetical protein